jgi:lysophospholipase L1-like esterase
MNLLVWQVIYVVAAAVMLPFAPLLFLQGQYTRRKVGLLPDATGERTGVAGEGDEEVKLFVIGESTVAGLGARTHEFALAGRFAEQLAKRIGRRVRWSVIGKNGVTAGRTIRELLPQVPEERFDYILVGLGGNDVLKLSSPRKWRRDMTQLLGILREKNPNAVIFLSNCPMIKASPAIPQPIKFLLWKLSNMHDANIRELTAEMDRVFYYHQPRKIEVEGFFADGIHPSEKGYADWTEAMMRFFDENYEWKPSNQ